MTFSPSHAGDATRTPTTCYACGRHAIGIGMGNGERDPKWLCAECVPLIDHLRHIKRFDPYEIDAVDGAVEAAGEYMGSIGKTDLAEFEADEARVLCRTIVQAFGDRLRAVIREGRAPF